MPFESQQDARIEDQKRISCIAAVLSDPRLATPLDSLIDRAHIASLHARLGSALNSSEPAQTLASAVYFRTVRLKYIGALLRAFQSLPDHDLSTFTLINANWRLTAAELNCLGPARLKISLRTHLKRIAITDMPGIFIAVLHGEFESNSQTYQLHFHGVTTALKACHLPSLRGRWGYQQTVSGAAPVMLKPMNNRFSQISYLFQSFWPKRFIYRTDDGKVIRGRLKQRIDEPYHTHVLLWLDRYQISDLILVNGARFSSGELQTRGISCTREPCWYSSNGDNV